MDNQKFQSGAVIDPRTKEEKKSDPKLSELVTSVAPVTWIEKSQTEWRKFPIFNQGQSGSCVAQTTAKELGIMRQLKDGVYVHFSATHVYQPRTNRPNAGMIALESGIAAEKGVTLEVLVPSQNMSDAQMDAVQIEEYKKKVGEVFAGPVSVELPARDIDTVASVIQKTGKGVMVWFYFQIDEWTEKPMIKNTTLDLYATSTCRHSVTAVDFFLIGGKKYLLIEDSWGTSYGMAGQRLISEEFFKVRNWYARYLQNFKFDMPMSTKPRYTFKMDFGIGAEGKEVKMLQDCLKFEGVFPNNTESTGVFGGVTEKAVQKFQVRYFIAKQGDEGFGRVGPRTRAKLNELYGV